MLKVGLTGGIGSGKSFVAEIFKKLGIPVYEADARAKALMLSEEVMPRIEESFGKDSYVQGELNRQFLADKVFSNEDELKKLNAIVHPAVQKDFSRWHETQNAPYTLREAAILHESGSADDCDQIILVRAPIQVRLKRVMERDGVLKEEVEKRMRNQWSEEEKAKHSDFMIWNDEEHMLLPQIIEIHEKLKSLSLL